MENDNNDNNKNPDWINFLKDSIEHQNKKPVPIGTLALPFAYEDRSDRMTASELHEVMKSLEGFPDKVIFYVHPGDPEPVEDNNKVIIYLTDGFEVDKVLH
jgi:hypothetical protein